MHAFEMVAVMHSLEEKSAFGFISGDKTLYCRFYTGITSSCFERIEIIEFPRDLSVRLPYILFHGLIDTEHFVSRNENLVYLKSSHTFKQEVLQFVVMERRMVLPMMMLMISTSLKIKVTNRRSQSAC